MTKPQDLKKEPDNLHLAPWLVVANIRYKDFKNQTIKKSSTVVARSFTKLAAKKTIDFLRTSKQLKHVGFNETGIWSEVIGKAPSYVGFSPNGVSIKEEVTKYTIVKKEDYIHG